MWERNTDWLSLACAPTRDWACNPGMFPDQGLNQCPFSLWNDAQPTESCQPRPYESFLCQLTNNFQSAIFFSFLHFLSIVISQILIISSSERKLWNAERNSYLKYLFMLVPGTIKTWGNDTSSLYKTHHKQWYLQWWRGRKIKFYFIGNKSNRCWCFSP